jgi:plastocyanin
MTDDTTDTLTDPPEADAPDTDASTTDVAVPESAAIEPAPPAAVPFWQRPHVERYLLPLVLPIVVVVGLVIYVLNLSRVFLSGHGHIPVVVGSVITVAILLGATVLSNSTRLRSSSIALMTALFALVIFTSGWLVLGHSQVKGAASAPLTATGPAAGKIDLASLASLKFTPTSFTVKTGIYSVTLTDNATGPHTLDFDDTTTLFAGLAVNGAGEKQTSRIFFGAAGDYTFFCAIPGHRAAGMQGVVHVTGPPMTLVQAEAAAAKK